MHICAKQSSSTVLAFSQESCLVTAIFETTPTHTHTHTHTHTGVGTWHTADPLPIDVRMWVYTVILY